MGVSWDNIALCIKLCKSNFYWVEFSDTQVEVRILLNDRIMTIKPNRNETFPIDFFVHYQERKIGVVCILENKTITESTVLQMKNAIGRFQTDEIMLVTNNQISVPIKRLANKHRIRIATIDEVLSIRYGVNI